MLSPTTGAPLITRIAFIRHGEVDNPQKVYYGRLPGFDLSAEGRRQAAAAGRYLAESFTLEQVFSSPMQRAQQTAAIIAQGKAVRVSPYLNEVYSGNDGITLAALAERQWDLYSGSAAEYEQPAALVARFAHFIAEIRQRHAGKTVAAVSHGDPIAFLILSIQGESALPGNRRKLAQLGVPDGYPAPASVTLVSYHTADAAEIPSLTYHKPY
jgi:broad specificity phosphatase PhoE